MNRFLAVFMAFTMLPLIAFAPAVAASDVVLIDAGYTHQTSAKLVHWEVMNDGTVLTVDGNGNLSVNAFSNGILVPLWTIDLNVTANGARLDDAQLLTAVAHDEGVFVVHMDSKLRIAIFRPQNESTTWIGTVKATCGLHTSGDADERKNTRTKEPLEFTHPPIQSGFNSFLVLA